MKNNVGLMIIAVAATIAFCFLNELRYALIVLVLAFWFVDDAKTTSKVLQPIMIWVSARVVLSFFTFLMTGLSDLIAAFANRWNNIDTQVLAFVSPITTLWMVVFLTLCVFFFLQNKNVPLYGSWAEKAAELLHGLRKPKPVKRPIKAEVVEEDK